MKYTIKYIIALCIVIVVFLMFFNRAAGNIFPGLVKVVDDFSEQIYKSIARVQVGVKNTAGVFFTQSVTVDSLQKTYDDVNARTPRSDKIRILIVPGHEPAYGGTEYKNLKERDLVVTISNELAELLSSNSRYEVIIARGKQGWNPEFAEYFTKEWENILAWKNQYQMEMIRLVGEGKVHIQSDVVEHNNAAPDVARRLYGINKWVNENGVDIAIHLHINDYPRKTNEGKFTGYAIYIPEGQYSNSAATGAVADSIEKRLSKYFPRSNMPKEQAGIIEDQELIAIGRHNTVDAASLLVEYGYIYESQYEEKDVRDAILKEYALATFLGIQDFFGAEQSLAGGRDSYLLHHVWDDGDALDVVALQFVLAHEGYYPPAGRTKNECGYSGKIGPCTLAALSAFQKDKGITGEKGTVGEKTQAALYGEQ